jgi:hypothetical protein
MAVYKFRVTFEEYDDIYRDIEIISTQNFFELHEAIQEAVKFDNKYDASFFMSDDYWMQGQEISLKGKKTKDGTKVHLMKNATLCDYIDDPHQKIYYYFDSTNPPWGFHVELIKIFLDESPDVIYPRVVKTTHDAPKQYTPVAREKGVAFDYDLPPDETFELETHIGRIEEGLPRSEDELMREDGDLGIMFSEEGSSEEVDEGDDM